MADGTPVGEPQTAGEQDGDHHAAPVPAPAAAADQGQGGGKVDWGWMRDKLLTPVLTGLATLMVGAVGSALTPIGERIAEELSPTSATVDGTILIGGRPVRVNVVLDGQTTDETNSLGRFFFEGVSKGRHGLRVGQAGALLYDNDFVVQRGDEIISLPAMDLNEAVPAMSPGRGPAGGNNPLFEPENGSPRPPLRPTLAPLPPEEPAGGGNGGDGGEVSPDGSPASGAINGLTPIIPMLPTATVRSGPLQPPVSSPRSGIPRTVTPAAGSPAASPRGNRTPGTPFPDGSAKPTPGFTATPQPTATPGSASADTLRLVVSVVQTADPGEGTGAAVTVELTGPGGALARVDRVTYYLDPAFQPSVVTRSDRAEGFELAFVTPGPFRLQAKVHLLDGSAIDLTAPVDIQPSQ